MNFEPQKFFIGMVDFFSILMPGALLAYLGVLLSQGCFRLVGAETWMVFFFASYLLGHFVFLLGAKLDDLIYEPLRKSTYWGQVERLADGKGLSANSWRALAASSWLFGKNADAAVMQAQRLKALALQGLSAEGTMNAYQWCKARLSKDHPEGLVTVQRFEADSKFFRSFSVVLFILALMLFFLALISPFLPRPGFFFICAGLFFVCAGLLPLAVWRYVDQRFKST